MTSQYLDIDSSFRNRQLDPNPASFDIYLHTTTTDNQISPVSDQTPLFPLDNSDGPNYSYMYVTLPSEPTKLWIDPIFIDNMELILPSIYDNAYLNKYIEDVTNGEFRKITAYRYDDQQYPASYTSFPEIASVDTTGTEITLVANTDASPIDGYYVGRTIFLLDGTHVGETRVVQAYDGTTLTIKVGENLYNSSLVLPAAGDTMAILDPYRFFVNIESGFTTATTEFPATAGSQTRYRIRHELPQFQGSAEIQSSRIIRIPTSIPRSPIGSWIWLTESDDYYRVIAYDAGTGDATIDTIINPLLPLFTPLPFDLLGYTRDQFNPVSIHLENRSTCYDIELIHLILPNQLLLTGQGSRIAFYSYIMVEIRAYAGSQGRVFHSNNPNFSKVLFNVMIYDTHDLSSPYVILNSSGQHQQVWLNPSDPIAFKFTIYLPNGEIYTTRADTTSPSLPDPTLQTSATFKLTPIR